MSLTVQEEIMKRYLQKKRDLKDNRDKGIGFFG